MKKLISVLLAVAVIFSAMFCVSASASRSTDFLEKFERDRAVTFKYNENTNRNIGFVKITDMSAGMKFVKNDNGEYDVKFVVFSKVGSVKVKILGDLNKVDAYFLIFKVNLVDISNGSEITDFSSGEYKSLLVAIDNGAVKYLKTTEETVEDFPAYGRVTVEHLGPDYDKIVKELPPEKQAELEGKTDEEIAEALAGFAESDNPKLRFLANFTNAFAKFYYKNENLVSLVISVPNEATGEMISFDITDDLYERKPYVYSITAEANEEDFDEPKFAIDITRPVNAWFNLRRIFVNIINYYR